MKRWNRSVYRMGQVISGFIVAGMMATGCFAQERVTTDLLPDNVEGVVWIPQVTEGRLVYLHGIAGEGIYLSRDQQGQLCLVPSLHLIAGNFESGGIAVTQTGPVKLAVYSHSVSTALQKGEQVSSEYLRLSLHSRDEGADVAIEQGMSGQLHFILNPRRKWTSWLRGDQPQARCEPISREVLRQLEQRWTLSRPFGGEGPHTASFAL